MSKCSDLLQQEAAVETCNMSTHVTEFHDQNQTAMGPLVWTETKEITISAMQYTV